MTLVDTSIWIDHLRAANQHLGALLDQQLVLIHPFVVGELACGTMRDRDSVLYLLSNLPAVPKATDDEVLYFIDQHQLMGRGLGYVDAHLLASTALHGSAQLWSRDRRLAAAARELRLGV